MEFHFAADFCGAGEAPLFPGEAGAGFVTGENCRADRSLRTPELTSGFVPLWWHGERPVSRAMRTAQGVYAAPTQELPAAELAGRSLPLWYRLRVPQEGVYRVTVSLRARAAGEVLVFVSRRRLVYRGMLAGGECADVGALVDVSPIIPGGQSDAAADETVDVAVVGDVFLQRLTVCEAREKVRRVFVLGDSTVTDQTASVPYAPYVSYAGWGQMLPWFLPDGLCVSNHAHSGLTTESFVSEGHWAIVEPRLGAGDLCLMQFGHNDQKLPHLDAGGGYTERLRAFVRGVRAKGAQPVLVTPLARNGWASDGLYHDLLGAYADAVCALGEAENVPVIGLHAHTCALLRGEGLESAKRWFYPGDFTHTNDYGAYRAAAFIGGALCRALGCTAPARAPWEPVAVPVLYPPEGCTLTPPEGTAVAFAEYDTERPGETLTRMEALRLAVAAFKFFPINGYKSPFADIVGQGSEAVTVQTAMQSGLIPASWTQDGSLHPACPVTLGEFLSVLLPGYACRSELSPETEESLAGGGDRAAALTRAQAAAICRRIRF